MVISGAAAWSRGLVRGCHTDAMEEDGPPRTDTLIRVLRRGEARLRRAARLLALALLLLIALVVALLVAVLDGGRGAPPPAGQPTMHLSGASSAATHSDPPRHPSAMLTDARSGTTGSKYLFWESRNGYAFCHGGFSYSRGDLVVPRDGVYRVFLQITYEQDDKSCDTLVLVNQVLYFRDAYPDDVPLLSSMDTVSCSLGHWTKSLYASGLFKLDANSSLRVTSSAPGLIIRSQHQVFFGAELLPQ
ncbi:lymphotoxin-alpha-like [Antennarius striatus]|uniref:lymphotoxin-alpha-like n=1 Tax=Antennarius striatus TaxID=241820 RepID=UPI0035B320E5